MALVNLVTLLSYTNVNSFSYTYFSYTYRATASTATITIILEQSPSYWSLDDVSIALQSGGSNLLSNPGFETGTVSGWHASCNPFGSGAPGTVTSGYAHSGSYSYFDGAYPNPDYLAQTVSVTSGSYYTVSFWLENLGGAPNEAIIIMSQ